MSDSSKVAAAEAAAGETHVVTTALSPEAAVKVVLKAWKGWTAAIAMSGETRRAVASGETAYTIETSVPGDPSRAQITLQLEPPDPDQPGMTRLSMAVVDYRLAEGRMGMQLYGALIVANSKIRKAEKRLEPVRVEIRRA